MPPLVLRARRTHLQPYRADSLFTKRNRTSIQFIKGGLYSKALSEIIDSLSDLSALNPTPEQVETAGEFMHDVSSICANERTRQNMTFRYLQELLGVSIQSEVTLEDKSC
jgi:hypothetical protein